MHTGCAYRSICPNGLDMLLAQLDMHFVLDMLLRSVLFAHRGSLLALDPRRVCQFRVMRNAGTTPTSSLFT